MKRLKAAYWFWLDLLKLYRTEGLGGLKKRYGHREPLDIFLRMAPFLEGKRGLEIGGPTPMFARGKAFPVYAVAERIDNCNSSANTFWHGRVSEGPFVFDWRKHRGRQYVLDAVNLGTIPSQSYDFLLSSHSIEHIANPIGALNEWLRILHNDAYLVLIVPHKDGTFDHRRPVTSLAHLIEDYVNRTPEDDQTHVAEILSLHDLDRDPSVQSIEELREIAVRNASERRLHHHVFDTRLVVQLLDHVGVEICDVQVVKPFHIIAVAKKIEAPFNRRNEDFLAATKHRTFGDLAN